MCNIQVNLPVTTYSVTNKIVVSVNYLLALAEERLQWDGASGNERDGAGRPLGLQRRGQERGPVGDGRVMGVTSLISLARAPEPEPVFQPCLRDPGVVLRHADLRQQLHGIVQARPIRQRGLRRGVRLLLEVALVVVDSWARDQVRRQVHLRGPSRPVDTPNVLLKQMHSVCHKG
jgi:hypothetical protein